MTNSSITNPLREDDETVRIALAALSIALHFCPLLHDATIRNDHHLA